MKEESRERIEEILMPCPFCGEKAELATTLMDGNGYVVNCINEKCDVEPSVCFTTKERTIRAWNTRKPVINKEYAEHIESTYIGYGLHEKLLNKANSKIGELTDALQNLIDNYHAKDGDMQARIKELEEQK